MAVTDRLAGDHVERTPPRELKSLARPVAVEIVSSAQETLKHGILAINEFYHHRVACEACHELSDLLQRNAFAHAEMVHNGEQQDQIESPGRSFEKRRTFAIAPADARARAREVEDER